jgi:hypothetical protein
MSILSFLRVIQGIQAQRGAPTPPSRNRRLEIEALERRAVLTLLDPTVPLAEPLEATSTTIVELSPLPYPYPLPPPGEVQPPDYYGGSGSGTGGPGPGEAPDPSSETLPADGSSGGGIGGPPPDPPSNSGGSGSGTGGGEAPIISALQSSHSGMWVWFTGTVTDPDGPVEGLTVYFRIGENPLAPTATVGADGIFESIPLVLPVGSMITAYTIDAQGHHSNLATCYT